MDPQLRLSNKQRKKQINDINKWSKAFSIFIAIYTDKYPAENTTRCQGTRRTGSRLATLQCPIPKRTRSNQVPMECSTPVLTHQVHTSPSQPEESAKSHQFSEQVLSSPHSNPDLQRLLQEIPHWKHLFPDQLYLGSHMMWLI